MTPADKRILLQFAKKLMPAHAYLQSLDDAYFGLFHDGQKSPRPKARIAAAHIAAWRQGDLLKGEGRIELSPNGRAFVRRYLAEHGEERFLAQHQIIIATGPEAAVHGALRQSHNSPLQWLKARKRAKGYGLQAIDFTAGEALARDYHRAAFIRARR